MKNLDEKVKNYLELRFEKVRHTDKGFRININELNKRDLNILTEIECNNEILIKRSGTGLVIIIE